MNKKLEYIEGIEKESEVLSNLNIRSMNKVQKMLKKVEKEQDSTYQNVKSSRYGSISAERL